MEWSAQIKQWVAIGAAVVVVAGVCWWFYGSTWKGSDVIRDMEASASSQEMNANSGQAPGNTADMRPTVAVNIGEEVHADDQPAGDSVRVVEARLSRISWIAVRDDMRIFGAGKVTPPQGGGTMTDVSVPLLKNTESGKTYKVVVYADDGDGVFDFKKDALVDGLDDTFSALNGD